MKRAWLISLSACCLLPSALAGGLDAASATNAIVGEAAGCPYAVKLGIAAAIRHRGTLRGVYGLNARHNASEPRWVWQAAARAWAESARRDLVAGATHFGNAADVRRGTFRGLRLTAVLGTGPHATYFFK